MINREINGPLWASLISPLPCLDSSQNCVQILQSLAVSNSPINKKIDESIAAIEEKIDEAVSSNSLSVKLAVFEPALQFFLGGTGGTTTTTTATGFINNVLGILSDPVGTINGLLRAIGIPLVRSVSGGNDLNRQSAIAISDLRVKVEELRKSKEEIALRTRMAVQDAVLEFDLTSREFQVSQELARRETRSFQLYQVSYRFGEGSTSTYLDRMNSLDRTRLATLRAWSAMRSQLERIKLLVLSNEDELE